METPAKVRVREAQDEARQAFNKCLHEWKLRDRESERRSGSGMGVHAGIISGIIGGGGGGGRGWGGPSTGYYLGIISIYWE